MSFLSIRHMHNTMREMERIEAMQSAIWYATLPANREKSHYWMIERKAKRGKNKWIVIRDFAGTKSEAAELFVKYFRNRSPKCRLRHILVY